MPSYIRTRTEFAVNSFTSGTQAAPSVSTFADGGFIVVWTTADPAQDGSGNAVKAQLFDSAGSKVGLEFLVDSAASGNQTTPSVATLSNGNFIVTWLTQADDGSEGIKAQLFGRSGDPIGGEFQVNLSGGNSHFTPNAAALANGGFVISWDDWNGFDMKAQIFSASGARVGAEFTVNTNTEAFQEYGDIIGLANGGFVATWRTTDSSADGSGHAVKAQVFSSTGAKVGAEFLVNSQTAGFQYSPSITALAGGGFVVAWYTTDTAQDGSESAIKAQIFTASGTKVGGEFLVNSQAAGQQQDPAVTATPDGGFVIAWTNWNAGQDGSSAAIKAQSFDASGAKVGAEMLVNTLATGAQFSPDLATLADGRVIVTWASESGDIDGASVRAQILGTQPAAPLPNTRPIIISNGGGTSVSLTHDEGATAVTTVVASDDGEPNNLRYSISGGGDSALFRIDSLTGALSFVQPPQFDPGASNSYSVTVAASDGQLSGFQSIQISVHHVNHVTIVSDGGYDWAQVSVDENQTAVTVVGAVDDDGAPLTYSITGGDDAYLFTIDAQTGALSFNAAPDYEQPQDHYWDNVYEVEVTASDGTRSDTQLIGVFVNDVEEARSFAITSDGGGDEAVVSLEENQTAVTAVTTQGAAGAVTYEIIGGYDASRFTINAATGELSFVDAPDFEQPPETGWGSHFSFYGGYQVVVGVSDGTSFDQQELKVVVGDVDEAPEFTSYWGDAHVELILAENDPQAGYVNAWDPDQYAWVSYGLSGADAALFQVDPYYGTLSFADAGGADFESPADADGDNVYEVTVVAYSGMLSAAQSFSIRIEDVNEGVSISSDGGGDDAMLWVAENGTWVTAVTAEGAGPAGITYEIVGGADASAFVIDAATGVLEFAFAPNFEWTADFDHDNVFEVIVRAGDGASSDDQHLSVNLYDIDEDPEFFDYTNGETVQLSVTENGSYVGDLLAFDPDGGSGPITYSITGGADARFFAIDANTGSLTFLDGSRPDFEAPADAGGDNVYDLVVTASFGSSSKSHAFAVNVVDANEAVAISSDGGGASAVVAVDEGQSQVTTVVGHDPEGVAPVYSIVGGADAALFAIDAATGVLSFVQAPDREAPGDAGGDNVYNVTVAASDGDYVTSQDLAIAVGNVDEPTGFVSYSGSDIVYLWADENSTVAAQAEAVDGDGDPVTYSITGGPDSALFVIDAATGALSFAVAPDFESPADSDGDNVYAVVVTATAGSSSDWQAYGLMVRNVNEGVVITSNGGGAGASVSASENQRAATVVHAEDRDGTLPTFAIVGGADAARFTIDARSGVLQFVSAPDREAPGDANHDNVYDVVVRATDGTFFDDQALAVTVGNVDEGVGIVSYGGADTVLLNLAENGTTIGQVAAVDLDGDAVTYAIVGGADSALFRIDPATGALSFAAPPNFEAPADANGDNVYKVEVAASSGAFTDSQAFAVTITNVNEPLAITSNGGGTSAAVSVAENGRYVTLVVAADPDGTPPSYSIVGGADAARFTINAQSGLLEFVAAPNYEAPGDANGDNVYSVIVQAGDGSFVDLQTLSVSVLNVRDGNNVTGTTGGDSISGTSTNPALRTTDSEDTVSGRDGNDTIIGLGGNDILSGDAGNDTLTGGAGADRLTGGLGKDEFVYNSTSESTAAARDVITDFSHSQNDRISLSGIDANSVLAGNQAFAFIGSAAFSGVAGQLRFEHVGGSTFVSGDLDGDRVADFQIELSGTITPVASDFVL